MKHVAVLLLLAAAAHAQGRRPHEPGAIKPARMICGINTMGTIVTAKSSLLAIAEIASPIATPVSETSESNSHCCDALPLKCVK